MSDTQVAATLCTVPPVAEPIGRKLAPLRPYREIGLCVQKDEVPHCRPCEVSEPPAQRVVQGTDLKLCSFTLEQISGKSWGGSAHST